MAIKLFSLLRLVEFLLQAEESRTPVRPFYASSGERSGAERVLDGVKMLFWMGMAAWIGGCIARLG